MRYALISTALGRMGLGWTEAGIARFSLPGGDAEARMRGAGAVPGEPEQALVDRILRYAEGERMEFDDIAVDVSGASEFEQRVYNDIRTLRWGETTTYGDIARRLGDLTLSRAVGKALGDNPVPLIIPCHRVLAANGRTGGFSAPGGVTSKMRMLALECAAPGGQYAFGF